MVCADSCHGEGGEGDGDRESRQTNLVGKSRALKSP